MSNASRNWLNNLSPRFLRWLINTWGPNLCAGIRIQTMAPDYLHIEVVLNMHWYNKNYVGTHYGGSIFSLTDPYYMLMLIKHLGPHYLVWDKAANIQYKKPGRGQLKAVFDLTLAEIASIREQADINTKYTFDKMVFVHDEAGDVVAEVVKTLYVRKK